MGWTHYLNAFHAGRPGITETVLRRSRDRDGGDPYQWLLEAIPKRARVLDLACGSAPMWPGLTGRAYVGVDAAPAELAAAQAAGAGPLIQAHAGALPLADGSVDVVACSMGLQVLMPPPKVLTEIARVLAPGGRLVATAPATGPLGPGDAVVVAGLLAALGRGLTYPNDAELRAVRDHLARAGLRLIEDRRRRFGYRPRTRTDAETFVASLYLPGLPHRRYRWARAYVNVLGHAGVELPVPIRRITATARPAGGGGRCPER